MNHQKYERRDSFYGIIVGYNRSGCYVQEINGSEMGYYKGDGRIGDKVLCSVKYLCNEQHDHLFLELDSVLETAPSHSGRAAA